MKKNLSDKNGQNRTRISLIDSLKDHFNERTDIAFAFLYGSQARGNATKLSDVDVAVYFPPERRHPVEYEEATYYSTEGEIWGDLERMFGVGQVQKHLRS